MTPPGIVSIFNSSRSQFPLAQLHHQEGGQNIPSLITVQEEDYLTKCL